MNPSSFQCSACGAMVTDHKSPYCPNCLVIINRSAVEKKENNSEEKTIPVASPFDEELIGGFGSPHMKRGLVYGYGLYVTNKRLIGIKKRDLIFLKATIGISKRDLNPKKIVELEKDKDLEIKKENIFQIGLKSPKWGFAGHIFIILKSGETEKIVMADKDEFVYVTELMQKFFPEVIRING